MTGLEKLLRWHSMRGGISTQEATATGNPATFETTLVRPLVKCEAAFMAQQSGTGDPSPENARPITGWTGLTVNVSPTASGGTEYPVNWQTEAGTVYGGYVDLVSGVLTVTHKIVDLGTLRWVKSSSGQHRFAAGNAPLYKKTDNMHLMCSEYKPDGYGNGSVGYYGADGTIRYYLYVGSGGDPAREFYIVDSNYSDASAFQSAVNGVKVVYELDTPETYSLAPQTIRTLAGENNVWSNANGDMTVKYVKKGA